MPPVLYILAILLLSTLLAHAGCPVLDIRWAGRPSSVIVNGERDAIEVSSPLISMKHGNSISICSYGYVLFGSQPCAIQNHIDFSTFNKSGAYLWVPNTDITAANITYGAAVLSSTSESVYAVKFTDLQFAVYPECNASAILVLHKDGTVQMSTISIPSYSRCVTQITAGYIGASASKVIMDSSMYYYNYNINSSNLGKTCIYDPYASVANYNVPSSELQALEALYLKTKGNDWLYKYGWLNHSISACYWYGVLCSPQSKTVNHTQVRVVQAVYLRSNRMQGDIPTEIHSLGNLQYLDISDNSIIHQIPAELGMMTALTKLCLYENQLTGNIPVFFKSLRLLEYLDLSVNHLSHSIPTEIKDLTSLVYFNFSYNSLTGTIPPDFGALKNLQTFEISANSITGSIPHQLGSFGSLITFDAYSNNIDGTIPATLGSLSELVYLYLSYNLISGTIPSQFGSLSYIQSLYIHDNKLSGTLPPQLGSLKHLVMMSLTNNRLVKTIPSQLESLSSLQVLYLSGNKLTGEIPPELGGIKRLQFLDLSYNKLGGSIPNAFSKLQLKLADLSHNLFSGSVTTIFSEMKDLFELSLLNNKFTGAIPYIKSPSISSLVLGSNRFTGNLTHHAANCSSLQTLVLSNNCLDITAIHEAGLCHCTKLQSLVLDNIETGCIPLNSIKWLTWAGRRDAIHLPKCIWSLPRLTIFSASGNAMKFEMPTEDELTAPLETLILMNNKAYGPLPQNILSTSTSIATIRLARNYIRGYLPQVDPNLDYSSLDTLDFTVNRLSCEAESFLTSIGNSDPKKVSVSVLSGNLFFCPPKIFEKYSSVDKDSSATVCHSALFYASFVATCIVCVLIGVWMFYVSRSRRLIEGSTLDDAAKSTSEIIVELSILKRLSSKSILRSTSLSSIDSATSARNDFDVVVGILIQWWKLSTALMFLMIAFVFPVYAYAPKPLSCIGGWFASLIDVRSYGALWLLLPVVLLVYFLIIHLLPITQTEDAKIVEITDEQLENRRRLQWKSRVVLGSMLILIILINSVYVVSSLNKSVNSSGKIAILVLVSVFKLLYSTTVPRYLLLNEAANFSSNEESRAYFSRKLMYVFCTLAAVSPSILPCMVSAVMDESCFSDLLRKPIMNTVLIPMKKCANYFITDIEGNIIDSICNYKKYELVTTSRVPFIYSYNCSGSTMTSYAPLLCLSCLILVLSMVIMFVTPLLCKNPEKSSILNPFNTKLYLLFPVVMWHYWDKTFTPTDAEWSYDDAGIDIVIQNIMILSMQITFGVAVPWLSVVAWITMTFATCVWIAIYYEVSHQNPEIMKKVCVIPRVPKSIVRMLGLVMAFSIAWLLLDQFDDSDPSQPPSVISIPILIIMLIFAFASRPILEKWYNASSSKRIRSVARGSPMKLTESNVSVVDLQIETKAEGVLETVENPMI